jgi:hypothetical protein
MKFIFSFFLTFLILSVSAQKIVRAEKVTDHSIHVIGNGYVVPNSGKFIYINGFSDYGDLLEFVQGDKTSTKKYQGVMSIWCW